MLDFEYSVLDERPAPLIQLPAEGASGGGGGSSDDYSDDDMLGESILLAHEILFLWGRSKSMPLAGGVRGTKYCHFAKKNKPFMSLCWGGGVRNFDFSE